MKTLNLSKYFERLNLSQAPLNNEEGLYLMQSSQVENIAFENIDCFLHREIKTNIEHLEQKIFSNHRGGYCFELNGLFSNALDALNFTSRPLLARVMYRGTGINSRTHIILLVTINGKDYIADAGFGGPGTYHPVPFVIDREDPQSHGTFRITKNAEHGFLMQKKTDTNEWFNVYGFNLDQVYEADLVMSNFFTSTFPESHFRHNLIMARHLPNGRITLLNKQLTTLKDQITTQHEIKSHEELLNIMKDAFGIRTDAGFDFSRLFKNS